MYIGRNLSLAGVAVLPGGVRSIGFWPMGMLPQGATLTRSTTGTRYDASGATEMVAINGARFDHDPFTLAARGLLIEPARTNQFLQSKDLRASWTFFAASALNATQLIESSASSNHRAVQTIAYAAGDVVTLSATIWEVTGSAKRYAILYLANSTSDLAVFDAATGAFAVNGCTATMTRIGTNGSNPVWRCTMTATVTSTGSLGSGVRLSTSASASSPVIVYQGDGVSGMNITDLQYEFGAAASSPIPTTTAAAARAADVLILSGSALGLSDGDHMIRYRFDDGSTQGVVTTINGGSWTVPTTLDRRWIRAIERG